MYNGEHSILFVATHLKYTHRILTAILKSIIQFALLKAIFDCFVRMVANLHQMPHPVFVTT